MILRIYRERGHLSVRQADNLDNTLLGKVLMVMAMSLATMDIPQVDASLRQTGVSFARPSSNLQVEIWNLHPDRRG